MLTASKGHQVRGGRDGAGMLAASKGHQVRGGGRWSTPRLLAIACGSKTHSKTHTLQG